MAGGRSLRASGTASAHVSVLHVGADGDGTDTTDPAAPSKRTGGHTARLLPLPPAAFHILKAFHIPTLFFILTICLDNWVNTHAKMVCESSLQFALASSVG